MAVGWGVWVPGEEEMKPREKEREKEEILMLNSSEIFLFVCI
jgi:hypothetical protein